MHERRSSHARPTSHPQHADEGRTAGGHNPPYSPPFMLSLQRTMGNAAVQRVLHLTHAPRGVQRDVTEQDVGKTVKYKTAQGWFTGTLLELLPEDKVKIRAFKLGEVRDFPVPQANVLPNSANLPLAANNTVNVDWSTWTIQNADPALLDANHQGVTQLMGSGVLGRAGVIKSTGFGSCVGLAMADAVTQTGVVMHFQAQDDPQAFIPAILAAVQKITPVQGVPQWKTRVFLGEKPNSNSRSLAATVKDQFSNYGVTYDPDKGYGKVQVNLATGTISPENEVDLKKQVTNTDKFNVV